MLGYNDMNAGASGERECLRHFTRISLEFYPHLFDYCERVFQEWAGEAPPPRGRLSFRSSCLGWVGRERVDAGRELVPNRGTKAWLPRCT